MLYSLLLSVSAAVLANGSVLRRQDSTCQSIPSSGKADGSFNNGAPQLAGMPPEPEGTPPECYNAVDRADLPFGRLFHGNAKFFPAGQLNTPDKFQDKWYPEGSDSATQSACGIPDNAFSITKVAIHPYFLKYADLSRYCQQDVCISFWNEDGSSDMMLKVTDICSTDPSDPTHCESPVDIKLDRTKMKIMQHLTDKDDVEAYPQLTGSQYPDKIWWFFTKCWGDGLAQPAYQGNNWFTTPKLPNNLKWSQSNQEQQWKNNQKYYPAKGWETYPNGAYNPKRDTETAPPIGDWAPGDPTPAWQPIAGGKGWGVPGGNGPAAGSASSPSNSPSSPSNSASSPSNSASSPSNSASSPSNSAASPSNSTAAVSTEGSGQGENQGGSQDTPSGISKGNQIAGQLAANKVKQQADSVPSTSGSPDTPVASPSTPSEPEHEQDECDEL